MSERITLGGYQGDKSGHAPAVQFLAQDDGAARPGATIKDGGRFATATRKKGDATRVGLGPDLIDLFETDLAMSSGSQL